MNYWRQPRLGAICAFLYVLAFVGGTLYRSSQPALPDTANKPALAQNEILLNFASSHQSLFLMSAVLSVLGLAVLIGVALAIFQYMTANNKPLIARITLAVGVVGLLVSCLSTIIGTAALNSAASQYAAHHLVSTVKDFQNQGTLFSVLDIIGSEGIAIWLGLTAVTIIRVQGNRSIAGWSTLAACALAGIGFPIVLVLLVWCTGAGIALWRLSSFEVGLAAPAPAWEPDEPPTPEDEPAPHPRSTAAAGAGHANRPAGRRGSAARRRRR